MWVVLVTTHIKRKGEQVNMTNLNLDNLRATTGVFITESDFQVIQLEYLDYLKANNLTDSESNAEQFYEAWKAEQENLGTFTETSDGNIKYYCPEGADETKMTTQEFINQIDMTSYHWENLCRSYWKIFKEILDTDVVDRQLVTNILSEETISHEQIYELQKVVKCRIGELLAE